MHREKFKSFLQKRSFLITGGMAILAIFIAMVVGGILIFMIGINPFAAYQSFFRGIFGSVYGFGETMNKFTPLLCCALSFSLAQKSGFFNLGSEGQLYMGALCSVLMASHLSDMPAVPAIFFSVLAGIFGGAALSLVAGILKILFDANELLTTMMLNYIMTYIIALLVSGAMKDPQSAMEQTASVPANTRLPSVLTDSRLHAGLFIALAVLILVWFLHQRTVRGFEMRLSGINPKSAHYAGVNEKRALIIAIIVSGALSGLGGSLELLGNQYKLMDGFSNNFGFDGIGIAVMGQYNPIGILLSAFLFAALRIGTSSMQRSMKVPTPLLYILQGIIIIAVIVSNYYVRRIKDSLVEGRPVG